MVPRDLSVVAVDRRPKPPGLIDAAFRVARLSPFHVLRGRRLVVLSVVAGIPPLIVLILMVIGQADALSATAYKEVFDSLYVNAIFPLVALFLGAAALGDDVDDGTVLYMRLRPIPRSSMVIGRYFAALLSCLVLFLPAVSALYLIQIGGAGFEHVIRYQSLWIGGLCAAAASTVIFTAVFQLLGVLSRRAVLFGIILIAIQPLFLRLGGGLSWITAQLHVVNVLSEFSAASESQMATLDSLDEAGLLPTLGDSLWGIAIASVVFLAAACLIFSKREYTEKQGE